MDETTDVSTKKQLSINCMNKMRSIIERQLGFVAVSCNTTAIAISAASSVFPISASEASMLIQLTFYHC